eukprot:1206443-Amphidinium_carterae.1
MVETWLCCLAAEARIRAKTTGVIQKLARTQGVMHVPSQIPTTWWEWPEVFGAAWSWHDEHIDTLELRAVTLAVPARMRKPLARTSFFAPR